MKDLWPASSGSFETLLAILIKLAIGAVLGGLIGWERERGGRAAGIRTHMLIVFGVILFSEVSKAFPGTEQNRIASMIVSGIGFLGAGTILRVGPEVKGLTTAASIWAVSAIGMAISLGGIYLYLAVAATVLSLLTLSVVSRIERMLIPGSHPSDLLVSLGEQTDISGVLLALNEAGMRITQTQVLQLKPTVELQLHVSGDRDAILRTAAAVSGVRGARWTD